MYMGVCIHVHHIVYLNFHSSLECFSFESNEEGQFPITIQVNDATKTGIGYKINGTYSEEDAPFQFKVH